MLGNPWGARTLRVRSGAVAMHLGMGALESVCLAGEERLDRLYASKLLLQRQDALAFKPGRSRGQVGAMGIALRRRIESFFQGAEWICALRASSRSSAFPLAREARRTVVLCRDRYSRRRSAVEG